MVTFTPRQVRHSRSFDLHFDEPVTSLFPHQPQYSITFTDATLILSAERGEDGEWISERDIGIAPELQLLAPSAIFAEDTGNIAGKQAFPRHLVPVKLSLIKDPEIRNQIIAQIVVPFWEELTAREVEERGETTHG